MEILLEAILALMASEVLQQKLATYEQPFSAHNYYRVSYYHTQCNCFKEKQTVKKKNPFVPSHRANDLPVELCTICRTH